MYDNLTRTNLEFAYREAEKRIAELEKACDETQKLLDKQIEVTYKLVEENTELKERNKELLESCEGATMMYKDLCKAKEIIQTLSTCLEGHHTNSFEYEQIKQAEAFLSEVEE